jgi:hypothetical protein
MNRFIGSSPVATTNNYYTIADIHNLQPLHTNLLSLFPLAFTICFLARIYNKGTIKVSLNYTLPIRLYYSTCNVKQFCVIVTNPSHGPRTENTSIALQRMSYGCHARLEREMFGARCMATSKHGPTENTVSIVCFL